MGELVGFSHSWRVTDLCIKGTQDADVTVLQGASVGRSGVVTVLFITGIRVLLPYRQRFPVLQQ